MAFTSGSNCWPLTCGTAQAAEQRREAAELWTCCAALAEHAARAGGADDDAAEALRHTLEVNARGRAVH